MSLNNYFSQRGSHKLGERFEFDTGEIREKPSFLQMMKKIRNIWRLETNPAYGPVKQLYIILQLHASPLFLSTHCARAFLLEGFAVFLLFFSQTDGFSRISPVLQISPIWLEKVARTRRIPEVYIGPHLTFEAKLLFF